mgnify:CR=1 FL=1
MAITIPITNDINPNIILVTDMTNKCSNRDLLQNNAVGIVLKVYS